jgi:phosphatidate cytidylyltransferase
MINKANLKKRLVFPAIAVPVAFIIVNSRISLSTHALRFLGMDEGLLPPIFAGQILSLIIVMFGAYEYTKMLSVANRKNAFWLGHLWILIVSGAYLIDYPVPATISNSALLMIVAFEAFFFGKDAQHGRWKRASLFFCGMAFLNIAAISIMSFFHEPIDTLFNAPDIPVIGRLDVVLIIASVFLCDTAAYFVGSAWGKHRLSPDISPNKSVEGSVAGLATSVIVMTICGLSMRNPEHPIFIGPLIGVILGVTAQVGDLLMSLVKRYFHVKDASDIIPGHGGVLDRFDSLFFAAAALYLFAWFWTR